MMTQPNPSYGGRNAIAGFLYQILRSLRVGLALSVTMMLDGDDIRGMRLTLEPEDGGDHRMLHGDRALVEQIKLRAERRRWSPGSVAKNVFPDLFKASVPGSQQAFRLVTTHSTGLEPLKHFLDARKRLEIGPTIRWGSRRLSVGECEGQLASKADIDPQDPRFSHLLDNFEIELFDDHQAAQDLDVLLVSILAPGESPEKTRFELIGRLLTFAREGRTVSAGALLAMVDSEAILRLALSQSLPEKLRKEAASACVRLGYDPAADARRSSLAISGHLTVLTGEAGQGKTWRLCDAALRQAETDELVIVTPAPATVEELTQIINDRIWLKGYGQPVAIQVMARRLRGLLPARDGYWLSVYIDDVQDRQLATQLAGLNWGDCGIRLIVSTQPRITEHITRVRSDALVLPINNFTSSELRHYLGSKEREQPLLTMPDDVFELLLKPIHARVFAELPKNASWHGATEYELFRDYWLFATNGSRAQRDHPQDRNGLLQLTATLLSKTPRYPWFTRDLSAAGIDDQASLRLEAVGLLRRVDDDQVVFASDRMLNWAVAEALLVRVEDMRPSPASVADELNRLETMRAPKAAVHRRLGYVFFDLLWLLADRAPADWVASLVSADALREQSRWRDQTTWMQLGSIGAAILPVLEHMARSSHGAETQLDLDRFLPIAVSEVAQTSAALTEAMIGRLLSADDEDVLEIGLACARHVPAPANLDQIWALHIERERDFDEKIDRETPGPKFSQIIRRQEASHDAVRLAISKSPQWLDQRLASTTDPIELDHCLWALNDRDCLGHDIAGEIWQKHRLRLLTQLSSDSAAMVHALGLFRDVENRDWLKGVTLDEDAPSSARILSSEARLDPRSALDRIRGGDTRYVWSDTDWWLPDLFRFDSIGLSQAIRQHAMHSDHPLTEAILFFSRHTECMDLSMLEWLLDEFANALQIFNATSDMDTQIGRLAHPIRVLSTLFEPWQFDCLHRRAGTALEEELLTFASLRSGRTSKSIDAIEQQCEQLLAMIDGTSFDRLALAALQRADRFGREDGLLAARWSGHFDIPATLNRLANQAPEEKHSHGEVLLLDALSSHACDDGIEAMIRHGCPVYLNAADIRKGAGRSSAGLKDRIDDLIAGGDAGDAAVAAKLACFLKAGTNLEIFVPLLADNSTDEDLRWSIISSFEEIGFYEPSLLPILQGLIKRQPTRRLSSLVTYLVFYGDATARQVVVDWWSELEVQGQSHLFEQFLSALLQKEDSRESALRLLKTLRQSGVARLSGDQLRALANANDKAAHDELFRNAYPTRRGIAPYPRDGLVECWFGRDDETPPEQRDPGRSDFWRVSPDGMAMLIQGFQEDAGESRSPGRPAVSPGAVFDIEIPVWRVGEAILFAKSLSDHLFEGPTTIKIEVVYQGLAGRELTSITGRRSVRGGKISRQEEIVLQTHVDGTAIDPNLPEIVHPLLEPLYALFDFYQLPLQLVTEELAAMQGRRP